MAWNWIGIYCGIFAGEAEEEELRLKEIEQRRQYRLDKKLKKEKASVEKMEGQ